MEPESQLQNKMEKEEKDVTTSEDTKKEEKENGYVTFNIFNCTAKFPFEPYPIQKEYMARVIRACCKSENALLESPTGTGKTLSLLCSALSWLDSVYTKRTHDDTQQNPFLNMLKSEDIGIGRPKIIYCSRTHSQLAQVIDELKSTPYMPKTAIIASRDHMCIHPEISKLNGFSLSHACTKATRCGFNGVRCNYKDSVDRIITSESRAKSWGIQDIEELHKLGKKEHVCPYFLQKERAKNADLILMPYNYLVDEKIRENFEIDYKNAIVIVDEAHNIGGVCEEVSSININERKLESMLFELMNLKTIIDNREKNEKKIDDNLECSAAECTQLNFMIEIMYDHLKQRDLNASEWKHFCQKDGYMVANANKMFDVLSDITCNKEQRTLDEYRMNRKICYEEDTISNKNSNKNINTEKLPEETKSIKSKPLNEVNAENIDLWISIMNKAITDLTATQPQNKLNLEDLFQAFKTISSIKNQIYFNKFNSLSFDDDLDKDEQIKRDILEDFYICLTSETEVQGKSKAQK